MGIVNSNAVAIHVARDNAVWKLVLSVKNPQPILAAALATVPTLKAKAKNMSSWMKVSPNVWKLLSIYKLEMQTTL